MPATADDGAEGQELLVGELGRITSELAAERRLTAMVAHDLAAPVQVILGLSELVLEESLPDPVRRRLEQIHRSAEGVATLVSDLRLGVSPNSSASLDLEDVDLGEEVGALVERGRLLAASKDMQLALTVDRSLGSCEVTLDLPRFDRAFTNLLGNAIKFGPHGSVVAVCVARLGDVVRLTIEDQGPGIDADSRERIFDVFHREERTAHLPGLGLGLYITRQIIEAHRGNISVVESGNGALFQVHLPVASRARLSESC